MPSVRSPMDRRGRFISAILKTLSAALPELSLRTEGLHPAGTTNASLLREAAVLVIFWIQETDGHFRGFLRPVWQPTHAFWREASRRLQCEWRATAPHGLQGPVSLIFVQAPTVRLALRGPLSSIRRIRRGAERVEAIIERSVVQRVEPSNALCPYAGSPSQHLWDFVG